MSTFPNDDPPDEQDVELGRLLEEAKPGTEQLDGELGLADFLRGQGKAIEPPCVGKYEVQKRLGSGGFGAVYMARQPGVERPVAIKILHDGATGRRWSPERLRREAQALGQLRHPNVVHVYDIDESPYGTFIAMEHVEGSTLAEWQQSRPWREIVAAYAQAGDAIVAAHRRGILHLDFKPENVLVDKEDRVKVVDFGLAGGPGVRAAVTGAWATLSEPTTIQSAELQTSAKGLTHGYAAPEQEENESVGARADQFSFCVSLWEALYGERPYSHPQIRDMGRTGATPVPRRGNPRGPRAIERALRRGLRARPEDRWPDLEAVVAILRRPPWYRRYTTWALFGGLAVAIPFVGVWWAATLAQCGDPRAELAGVWDDARREELAEAFRRSPVVYAADITETVTRQLDHATDGWANAVRASCVAAVRANLVRSDEYASERACFDRQRDRFVQLTDMLIEARPKVIEHALGLVDGLASEECKATRGTLVFTELLGEIDALNLAISAGFLDDALHEADRLLAIALQMGEPRIIAETKYARGRALDGIGRDREALADFIEAAAMAFQSDHDSLSAKAWLQLTWVAVMDLEDRERAREWSRMSMAAVERLGRPARIHADHLDAQGLLEVLRGDLRAAESAHLAALVQLERSLEPGDPRFLTTFEALAQVDVQQGEYDNAEAYYQRAFAIGIATLGPRHPVLAELHFALAWLAHERGDLDGIERALVMAESIVLACCRENADLLSGILAMRAESALARGCPSG